MFKGSVTALITPFTSGEIDEKAFVAFIEWQIGEGTHGVVSCGTTGESPTLSFSEHEYVTELCIKTVAGRIPVIAGTGSNSTAEAIRLTQHAEKAGADAALLATPYYNKPTQEGLYQHYKAVHDATGIPLILYNIPGRSVVDMKDETILRLAEACPRIVGNKDATGDLNRPVSLGKLLKGKRDNFAQISGEDGTAIAFNRAGGVGCISVSSNIVPKLCSQMQQAMQDGDYDTAEHIQQMLMPLHDAMFCETSPGPVKYAASLLGLCREEYRLPLVPIAEANKKKVRAALETLQLL
ncbi:MAG: 4-hydroxy-tetrahydrodipicolinate synthase [Rickettsiales bacterium]|nr:4-hydroxy-tetrahydrodipicolinate synthase [Rickettsiales bacterium]